MEPDDTFSTPKDFPETPEETAREVYTLADLRDWARATAGVQPPLRLAVFGDPVAHSASPPMHNAALVARGLNLGYTRIHVRPEELTEALRLVGEQGFVGVNLTIPHKEAAVALVDELDAGAASLGVINTVRVESTDGGRARLRGFNTDGPGFVRAVRTELGLEMASQRILLLGAGGGAGQAVARQCVAECCSRLVLVNRTYDKAQTLVTAMRGAATTEVSAVAWETEALRRALVETDLVVNTSSLGLKPGDASPLPPEAIPPHVRIFDTVYLASGAPTPLEISAQQAGVQAIGGRALLLHQGALSFEHWFGGKAPLEAMRRGLAAAATTAR